MFHVKHTQKCNKITKNPAKSTLYTWKKRLKSAFCHKKTKKQPQRTGKNPKNQVSEAFRNQIAPGPPAPHHPSMFYHLSSPQSFEFLPVRGRCHRYLQYPEVFCIKTAKPKFKKAFLPIVQSKRRNKIQAIYTSHRVFSSLSPKNEIDTHYELLGLIISCTIKSNAKDR